MAGRDEFDVGRVSDGMPDDVVAIAVLEPAAVCVVPAKVCIDDERHGPDIASTIHVAGRYEQP
jgi:hypothetical protein